MNLNRKIKQLSVFPIGLGCMAMSEFYGKTNQQESIETIHYALDHGVNLFDTADMYGFGENEKLLAKALGKRRKDILIATKFGILRDRSNPLTRGLNGHPKYVHQSVDASLARLKTDYIDLYYLHRVDPNVPIEDTIGAMSECVAQGKIRYIGLSEACASTIRKANSVHPIAAVQTEYSIGSREVEDNEILTTTQRFDISFVAYSPLCRALLTNDFSPQKLDDSDFRKYLPRFKQDNINKSIDNINALKEIADNKQCSLAQLSLAWLLAKSDNIIPIPGTRRIEHLKENIQAAFIKLTPQEQEEINVILANFKFDGDRYPIETIKDYNLNG